MTANLRILGIAGSLRKGSVNAGLLRLAGEVLPAGATLDIFDLASIPLYNGDVEAEGFPPAVAALRQAVTDADALLIATPEYNYSIPGVLKNAIDWASRPPQQPFAGKPAAIMGTGGWQGSARAQYHLRQVLSALDVHVLNKPEVQIPAAAELFDAAGGLKKPEVRDRVGQLTAALAAWTERLRW